jgi:hypothetical protein
MDWLSQLVFSCWGSGIGRFVVGRGESPVTDFGCNAWTENGVMKGLVLAFVRGEEGFLLSTEALLIGTITVLGLIVGLAEIRNNVVQELGDFSQAVAQLSQDYAYTSVSDTNVPSGIWTYGSIFSDSTDIQQAQATDANGITVTTQAPIDNE